MAFIHTTQVSTGNGSTQVATRKSANHQYVACLVATHTEASVKLNLEAQKAAEAELSVSLASRAERVAALGLSIEQAKAEHEAQGKAWYAKSAEVRKSFKAGVYIPGIDNVVKAELLKLGMQDPYSLDGAFGIVYADSNVERLTRTLASWSAPALGSQSVLSWHHSVPLASKALGGRDAEWARKRGHSVEIRTDIKVTETKKRAAV